jgi:hypothetical protein
MDWKQYEEEIAEYFREEYPDARITANAKLPGKFSKTDRQIDLLIEEQIIDLPFKLIVDTKCRSNKIDVKDVEEFVGLVRDVGADKGILISTEGYTQAAIQRAYSEDLILDVVNFKELKQYHGFVGIPYALPCGAVMQPPLGWIVDRTQGRAALAWLYERGLTLDEALARNEFMYVNFWGKKKPAEKLELAHDLDSLLNFQEGYMRKGTPVSRIEIVEGVKRTDARRTVIRIVTFDYYPGLKECTGFVDFEDFIFICVLFTLSEVEEKNFAKLRFVIRKVLPVTVSKNTDTKTLTISKAAETPKPVSKGTQT